MYETGRTAQVVKEMQRNKLDILGISETHLTQSEQKNLPSGELMLTSGRKDNTHAEGVALLLNKRTQKSLRGWEQHGSRIMKASFSTRSKKINMNIILIYAPTNEAEEEDKDDFYKQLQTILDKLPEKDMNILMGDANAKIGQDNLGYEDVMGIHGDGTMNDNGERFANMCSFNNFVIGGSVFPHKKIHKTTWTSPDGKTENQIDHCCIAARFRRSLEDVKVIRGADVGSDHHLLLAKIKLHLRNYQKSGTIRQHKFNVNLLKIKEKREEFTVELRNKFEVLTGVENEDIEEHWSRIKESYTTTCNEVLGRKSFKHKEWIKQESLKMIDIRRQKKAMVNTSRTRSEKEKAREEYSKTAKEVKKSLKRDKEEFIAELAGNAERAAASGQLRTLYELTRNLSGKHRRAEVPVNDREGNRIPEQEKQMKRWAEYFEELLNRPPPDNPPDILPARRDLPISCDPPSLVEIKTAISQLNSGKAAGPDYIPPEALKADIDSSARVLDKLFTKIWTEERYPQDWKEGHIVKLPKKGDLRNCENYRGISLISITDKVFARIILNRMKTTTDEKLRDEQAGFRRNRSCIDQIATLRIIVEQSLEWNSSLIINFIDFKKAFDSIDREILWKIMRHYGIPDKLVTMIKKMYEDTHCRVIHEGRLSDSFEVKTGVRQGCLLSPFLFILAVDWLMKETTVGRRQGIQWTLWSHLEDLDYADDIALLSHTCQQMQNKSTELDQMARSIGLRIHPGKSKVLKIQTESTAGIRIDHKELEEVESFVYLGSIIDKTGGTKEDIKIRIGKARGAFKSLKNIWKDRNISIKTKLRLFNSNVKSVLYYGSETWNTTKGCTRKLQTFVNGCLRKILRIPWTAKVRNEEIWERTEFMKVSQEIGQRRWRWIGHTLRKKRSSITRQALQWNPQGHRQRGRPRETWRRSVQKEMSQKDYNWSKLSNLAQDRDDWRKFVRGLYPGKGEGL